MGICAALLVLVAIFALRNDPETSIVQPPSNAVCVAAQRDAFSGLVEGWRTLAGAMTAAESAASLSVLQPWTRALDAARGEVVGAGCPDPPRELVPVAELTVEVGRDSEVSQAEVHDLGELLSDLADTLQLSALEFDERLLDLPITCGEIAGQVSASYALRSVGTGAGRDVWAVLSIRNRSSRGVYAAVEAGWWPVGRWRARGGVVAGGVDGGVRRSVPHQSASVAGCRR